MNAVHEALKNRRAVRAYTDEPIAEDVLDRIVESALQAPSAYNAQLRDVVVVRDEAVKQKLVEASGQPKFAEAPVTFVLVGRVEVPDESYSDVLGDNWGFAAKFLGQLSPERLRESAFRDATLLGAMLLVAAQSEGIATCPTSGWDEEKVKEAIGLGGRDDRAIALLITAGHAAETPEHPGRSLSRRVNDSFDA